MHGKSFKYPDMNMSKFAWSREFNQFYQHSDVRAGGQYGNVTSLN